MVKRLTFLVVMMGLVVALVGPSYAGWSGQPASYTCTFGATPGTPPILSGSGTTPGTPPAGSGTYYCCKLVNVPAGQCFNLTDVSAASNNGARRLNIDSGSPSPSATECANATELFVYWEGASEASETGIQDFSTGLFFSGGKTGPGTDVLATTDNNNSNVSVSISGVWVPCYK